MKRAERIEREIARVNESIKARIEESTKNMSDKDKKWFAVKYEYMIGRHERKAAIKAAKIEEKIARKEARKEKLSLERQLRADQLRAGLQPGFSYGIAKRVLIGLIASHLIVYGGGYATRIYQEKKFPVKKVIEEPYKKEAILRTKPEVPEVTVSKIEEVEKEKAIQKEKYQGKNYKKLYHESVNANQEDKKSLWERIIEKDKKSEKLYIEAKELNKQLIEATNNYNTLAEKYNKDTEEIRTEANNKITNLKEKLGEVKEKLSEEEARLISYVVNVHKNEAENLPDRVKFSADIIHSLEDRIENPEELTKLMDKTNYSSGRNWYLIGIAPKQLNAEKKYYLVNLDRTFKHVSRAKGLETIEETLGIKGIGEYNVLLEFIVSPEIEARLKK